MASPFNGLLLVGSLLASIIWFKDTILLPWLLGFVAALATLFLVSRMPMTPGRGDALSAKASNMLYALSAAMVAGSAYLGWRASTETLGVMIAMWANASGACLGGAAAPIWFVRKFAK